MGFQVFREVGSWLQQESAQVIFALLWRGTEKVWENGSRRRECTWGRVGGTLGCPPELRL